MHTPEASTKEADEDPATVLAVVRRLVVFYRDGIDGGGTAERAFNVIARVVSA